MNDLLSILDKYFIPAANGETDQRKYITAYELMKDFLLDIAEFQCSRISLNDAFDKAMTKRFGYVFEVENCAIAGDFNTAEEAAEYILKYKTYKSDGTKVTYEEILSQIEGLHLNEYGVKVEGVSVHKMKNW